MGHMNSCMIGEILGDKGTFSLISFPLQSKTSGCCQYVDCTTSSNPVYGIEGVLLGAN